MTLLNILAAYKLNCPFRNLLLSHSFNICFNTSCSLFQHPTLALLGDLRSDLLQALPRPGASHLSRDGRHKGVPTSVNGPILDLNCFNTFSCATAMPQVKVERLPY